MAISDVIRKRLSDLKVPYFCNDYIGEYIIGNELIELQQEVEDQVQRLLNSLIIDTENDHNTKETARRMAKMYIKEVLAGRYTKPPKLTEFPNAKHLDEIYIVSPIKISSMCSHHFAPILGELSIGVIPNEKLIGLSKFARLSQWMFSRGHIQEEAIIMLADKIEELIEPQGLALVFKAEHLCMKWRGVKDNAYMTSSVMRGKFREVSDARMEFLQLIGDKT